MMEPTKLDCTSCDHFSKELEICKGRCAICDFYTPKKVDTQQLISEECRLIEKILLEKNRKYGDSAINPKRIFSKCSAMEGINVRMDDKLSRIESDQFDDEEEPEFDLIGYLILKRVSRKYHGTK